MQGIAARTSRLAHVWLPAIVLLGFVLVHIRSPELLIGPTNALFDAYQNLKPREDDRLDVLVVDIDEESIRRLGQWPWPRTQLAQLVDRLREAGAAVIAFDMAFAEADRTSPALAVREWNIPPAAREVLAAVSNMLPDNDEVFAQAVGRGGVVAGFALTQEQGGGPPLRTKAPFRKIGDADPARFAPEFQGFVALLPALEAAAAAVGAINARQTEDDVIRRAPLLFSVRDELYPSLSLAALRLRTRASVYNVRASGSRADADFGLGGIQNVQVGPLTLPTDAEGQLRVHYSAYTPDRYIPAWRVLQGEFANFTDAVVFIGTSAVGLNDLRLSPLGGVPGVEVHAQVVEQSLAGDHLTRPGWALMAEIGVALAGGLALIALVARLGAGWSGAVAAIGIVGVAAMSWLAFAGERLLIDPIFPAISLAAVFIVSTTVRRFRTERAERFVREAFSSYVSPNLVKHLIENPDALKLGGERRECSFVTTDLAGFTSLVERSQPAEVVALLNEYLGQMTAIAFRHEGTLDKIVGDAVAVLFGAPTPQADHARRAVACALEMDAFARDFSQAKRDAGMPLGRTRIGVNSGAVIVGNVGGGGMFDYRALGDMINTASRLETANRTLGTRISVAGATAAQVPGFVGRPVGHLVLKGKSESIEVLNALHPEEDRAPNVLAYRAAFALLEAEDPAALEAFRAAAAAYPDDALIAFQLARLEAGERGATIVMTEK